MLKLLKNMKAKERYMALICVVLVLGQIYFDLALPDYMSNLTVLIKTPGSQMAEIWGMGLSMLGCALASAVLCVLGGFLSARIASGYSFTLRENVFNKVTDFGLTEMLTFSVPSLINRTTNDITQVQMLISMGLQILIKSPVMAVWAVIKIVGKSWELSVVTAGFVVALLAMLLIVMAIVLPRVKLVQKQTDDINRITRENLNGINVVHAFNAEEYQDRKFEKANETLTGTQMFNQRTFAVLTPMMTLAMNGLALAIYWIGAALLSAMPAAAQLTMFADIIVFSTYATYVVMSLMMMTMIFMLMPAAQVSADRINEILDTHSTLDQGRTREGKGTGTVEFRDVSFSYPGSEHEQLRHISFTANKGETVAFIGATGSGKTTLVSLVARFYDATKGEVLVDGVNVKDYTFDALYDKLGYVTQKAVLFSGTVRDNVLFGESAQPAGDDGAREALELAQAEFVAKMPGELEADIAQGGGNVSGGQKQRLSIARALARKPEILVFDDSFSALDYKTDANLRAGLNTRLKGTTCLIVAQRIGTIRHANRIVVLDNGEAVGIGTHKELMKTCDVYREIAISQLSQDELGA